jgi:hypothetical protein
MHNPTGQHTVQPQHTAQPLATPSSQPRASRVDNILTVVFGTWLMLGLFVDGFFHNLTQLKLDSFFTLWHAMLYSGYMAVSLWMAWQVLRNIKLGYVGFKAIPVGYELGLLGSILFGLGGLLDMGWHLAWGIEQGVNALYSPTHLLLASSGVLILTTPLRSAWHSDPVGVRSSWKAFLPTFLSFLTSLSFISFIQQQYWSIAQMVHLYSNEYFGKLLSLCGMMFSSVIIFGGFLYLIRRWILPFGVFTLVLGLNTTLMLGMTQAGRIELPVIGQLAGLAFASGLLIDLLYLWLKPSSANISSLRLWAFLAPFSLWLTHFVAVKIRGSDLYLTLEMWTGVCVSTGLLGLMLSVLMFPPAIPAPAPTEA